MENGIEYSKKLKLKKGKYNLLLDDQRNTQDAYHASGDDRFAKLNWVIVRNYNDFVECIREHGLPALIGYDHDIDNLHYDECDTYDKWVEYHKKENHIPTGYDAVKWLVYYCDIADFSIPEGIIVTANTIGKKAISYYLINQKNYQQ